MKYLLSLLFIMSTSVSASDIKLNIEKQAAKINHCSQKQPCLISVVKQKDGYQAMVRHSVLITGYGVLKFKTPAKVYLIFDPEGNLLKKITTP